MVLQIFKRNALLISTIFGAAFGIALGFALRQFEISDEVKQLIDYPGEIFTRFVQLMIVPLVICNLIAGASSLNARTYARIIVKSFSYFFITTLFYATLGAIAAVVIKPGVLRQPSNSTRPDDDGDLGNERLTLQDSFLDLGRNIVPGNLFSAFFQQTQTVMETDAATNATVRVLKLREGTNMLGVITFSLIFGLILGTLGDQDEQASKLIGMFVAMNKVIMTMIRGIMWLTPVGTASLIAGKIVSSEDIGLLVEQLGMFLLTILGLNLVYQVVILQVAYFVIIRKNPFKFYFGLAQAIVTAFATASAMMALPVALESLTKLKLDPRLSRFLLPIAISISKDSGAFYASTASVFLAQLNGYDLGYGQLANVVLSSAAAAIATASVPNGIVTMVFVVLSTIGVPTKDIGLLYAVDWIMIRSPSNLLGNCYAIAFIEHWSKDELKRMKAPASDAPETEASDNV